MDHAPGVHAVRRRTGQIEIDPGYGFVTQVEGTPGPASQLAYTCTYVFPDGVFEGVEHQVPCAGRWPDPLDVIPHPVNVPFPAYRVNRRLQAYMLPELPDFGPCPQGAARTSAGGGLFSAWSMASEAERRAFADQLKGYL